LHSGKLSSTAGRGGRAGGILYLSYMLVPLDATGKFSIHSYITGNVYVDAWGYLP
jgi:hypothetical protein